jgi:hypothetical protein
MGNVLRCGGVDMKLMWGWNVDGNDADGNVGVPMLTG